MILIPSAAFVTEEFQAEFGAIPPCFLPIGNKRLYLYQIEALKEAFPDEDIWISLPENYVISEFDELTLNANRVNVIHLDPSFTLNTSLAKCIEQICEDDQPLRILLGDTLLNKLPKDEDIIATAHAESEYKWKFEKTEFDNSVVWCGYFSIKNPFLLLHYLSQENTSFEQALMSYGDDLRTPRIIIDGWRDFGHINTYYRNRSEVTTPRVFNQLTSSNGWLRKQSSNSKKILGEFSWFERIPNDLQIYCPRTYLDENDRNDSKAYFIEYLNIPPLNELYVYGENQPKFWKNIFSLCFDFLNQAKSYTLTEKQKKEAIESQTHLVRTKTFSRMENVKQSFSNIDFDSPVNFNGRTVNSINYIVARCIELAESTASQPTICHGDFCFSNILFDSRANRIKVIDPRGIDWLDRPTITGDLNYDLAKLTHSAIGMYDHIIAGHYALSYDKTELPLHIEFEIFSSNKMNEVHDIFMDKMRQYNFDIATIIPLTVLLFLSMLPLHNDDNDRQIALLANAIRLYDSFNLEAGR